MLGKVVSQCIFVDVEGISVDGNMTIIIVMARLLDSFFMDTAHLVGLLCHDLMCEWIVNVH